VERKQAEEEREDMTKLVLSVEDSIFGTMECHTVIAEPSYLSNCIWVNIMIAGDDLTLESTKKLVALLQQTIDEVEGKV
jgi:hypothetical protein